MVGPNYGQQTVPFYIHSTVSVLNTVARYSHWLNIRSEIINFNWAQCAQLYTANDSTQTPEFCLFLSNLSLIYEGATGQPKQTTSLCDPLTTLLSLLYIQNEYIVCMILMKEMYHASLYKYMVKSYNIYYISTVHTRCIEALIL